MKLGVWLRVATAMLVVVGTASCTSQHAHHTTKPPRHDTLWVAPTGSDRAPGTQERPLRQISRAAQMVVPGAVVHVAPGNYAAVTTTRDGKPGKPITFISDRKWEAHVLADRARSAWTNTAAWIVIDGMDISGSQYNGILTFASHGRFLHNHIHDVNAPSCARGGAGIVAETYVASDNDTVGNVIDHINAPRGCSRVHGIYYQSPHAGRILDNIVYATSGWGIHLWHNARYVTIANNTVVDNAQGGIVVGGSLEGNDIPPGRAVGVLVTNNLVADNGGPGIAETGRVGANAYVGNLVYRNRFGGIKVGLDSTPVDTLRVNPGFVGATRDDFRVVRTSAAVDSGTPLGAPSYDIDGIRRPQGLGVDIGAYETTS